MTARSLGLVALAGALVAGLGAVGVVASEEPHLSADTFDPWLIVYALGLAVTLGVLPFVLQERRLRRADHEVPDWEPALISWGGIAAGALVAFLAIAALAGFEAASAAGALAIVGAAECALVVGGLLLLVLTTG